MVGALHRDDDRARRGRPDVRPAHAARSQRPRTRRRRV